MTRHVEQKQEEGAMALLLHYTGVALNHMLTGIMRTLIDRESNRWSFNL
jgi:hypothetical protein